LIRFVRSCRDSLRCLQDLSNNPGIVFYSEGVSYAPYLAPVINALGALCDDKIYYLASDASDPMLVDPPTHVKSYYIGKGNIQTYVLNHLSARLLATTMPDIETFHIKRSPNVRHYAYLHHSMVSTHMVYRKGAFDHFDSIFCVGPHHDQEIREWETLKSLPAKQLIEHGHPPLDSLIAAAKANPAPIVQSENRLNILLAPSWGPQGVMETQAEEIVEILLNAGHYVRVRPHPRTRQISGPVLDALAKKFMGNPDFDMSEDTTRYEALLQSHIMISDWSGVAMEFAFGLERPVIFIDVPRKINNAEYAEISTEPLEALYREEVGRVIRPDQSTELPKILASIQKDNPQFGDRMRELRARHIYNIGTSAEIGARKLAELAVGSSTDS